ncbi:Bestrophin/UPF0187 [Niveomyces insectorum RCEF 264]|uniref:Bestrophin/UPF0187 n=1 Tax=Niveomyces insectorum RCEF 264 TaxID=1081102 RepID=A0A167P3H9_9HYPO|nr:Bestrophin/UPF0187 [Niveomyces insectorum RCEF 264]
MAEEGGVGGFSVSHGDSETINEHQDSRPPPNIVPVPLGSMDGPLSPVAHTPNPFSRQHTSLDLDDYFMHGSILPKMILPLLFLGAWSTCITCVSRFTSTSLGISNTLLTVTGFVVGLGLSFRSSTAYERYAEGRRYWAQLINTSNCLGRVFWVHAKEREENRDRDVLAKLTALNLVVAFAVALKHKLRFEPYTDYEDISGLVSHLDTYAREATLNDPGRPLGRRYGALKTAGEFLGISFATSNPRKIIKRSKRPLGNLPLEIISYLASFTDELIQNGQLAIPMQQTLAYNNIATLNDVLTGTERVLTTPVPLAYAIAISQITWLYVFLLPFQLYSSLGWVTIPASMAGGYIILGLLFIGREVENPFGRDVNDLPLEIYCAQIAAEMDLIASKSKPANRDWVESLDNKVLWPLSSSGWNVWMHRGESKVRAALRTKCENSAEGQEKNRSGENGKEAKNDNVRVVEENV